LGTLRLPYFRFCKGADLWSTLRDAGQAVRQCLRAARRELYHKGVLELAERWGNHAAMTSTTGMPVRKRCGKTSIVWAHFKEVDSYFAQCLSCDAVLSYRTSVSNLKKHLDTKHPSIIRTSRNRRCIMADGLNDPIFSDIMQEEVVKMLEDESDGSHITDSVKIPRKQLPAAFQKKISKTDEGGLVINLRLNDLNATIKSPQDEFSVFGEYTASELRCLKDPKYARLLAEAKLKISGVLHEIALQRIMLDEQDISITSFTLPAVIASTFNTENETPDNPDMACE
ncbi:hypothetical protein C0J52_21234, partial [Blattella germanica]